MESICRTCSKGCSGMLRCQHCQLYSYCSTECKEKDWLKHKRACISYKPDLFYQRKIDRNIRKYSENLNAITKKILDNIDHYRKLYKAEGPDFTNNIRILLTGKNIDAFFRQLSKHSYDKSLNWFFQKYFLGFVSKKHHSFPLIVMMQVKDLKLGPPNKRSAVVSIEFAKGLNDKVRMTLLSYSDIPDPPPPPE